MFVIRFFAMLFALLSGLFTPITSMPRWAQMLTYLNPTRYFVKRCEVFTSRVVGSRIYSTAQLAVYALASCSLALLSCYKGAQSRPLLPPRSDEKALPLPS